MITKCLQNNYGLLKYIEYDNRIIITYLKIHDKFISNKIGDYFLYNFKYLHAYKNKPIILYAWEECVNPYKLLKFYQRNGFQLSYEDNHIDHFYKVYSMYTIPELYKLKRLL